MFVKTTLKYFTSRSQSQKKTKDINILFPIEYIHLTTWYILILSWVLSYFSGWIEMFLAWTIFWCMYVSMSDIWECSKCWNELCSLRHKNRRLIAFIWLGLSLVL